MFFRDSVLRARQLVVLAALTAVCWGAAGDDAQSATYGYLRSMEYAPNGQSIAIATARAVEIWDTALNKVLQTYPLDPLPSRMRLAWSPDSKSLALNTERRILLWDAGAATARKEVQYDPVLPAHFPGTMPAPFPPSLAWSPKSDRLAYLTGPGGAMTGPMILERNSPYWLNPVPLSRTLGPVPGRSKIQADRFYEVAWSPDGSQLAAIFDNTVKIWDADTGAEIRALKLPTFNAITGRRQDKWPLLTWSPTGAKIATCDRLNFVEIWDAATGEILLKLDGGNSTHTRLAWSRKGDRVALATEQSVTVWDAITGASLTHSQNGVVAEFAAFSPELDHGLLAAREGQVEFWPPVSVPSTPLFAAWGADDRLAVWAQSGEYKVFDLLRGSAPLEGKAAVWGAQSLAWSVLGTFLAIPDDHGVLSVLSEYPTGYLGASRKLAGAKPPVYAIAFAPSSQWIAALAGGSLWVWDNSRNEPPRRFPVAGVSMVWTSDHTVLIAGLDGSVSDFDIRTGKQDWTFTPPSKGTAEPARLAPGGVYFFASNALWRREREGAKSVRGFLQAPDWNADGTGYVLGPDVRQGFPVRILSCATGEPIGTLRLTPLWMQNLTRVVWSPDGRHVAAVAPGALSIQRLLAPKD